MGSSFSTDIYETLARHASDLVHWVEGSGPVLTDSRPLVGGLSEELQIELLDCALKNDPETAPSTDRTPSDLTLTHKPGLLVLWRLRARDDNPLESVQARSEPASVLERPVEDGYKVSGTVFDNRNRFNPREFNLADVGNFVDVSNADAKGHEVKLYRSPLGTQLGSLGGLQGRLQWDTGEPASWAIITCEVALLHTTGTRSYCAQADINGDFRLAFASLPFPKMQGDSRPHYECTLSIRTLKTASGERWHQPDDFAGADLKRLTEDVFSASINLEFVAGTTQRVTSSGSDDFLIVKGTT